MRPSVDSTNMSTAEDQTPYACTTCHRSFRHVTEYKTITVLSVEREQLPKFVKQTECISGFLYFTHSGGKVFQKGYFPVEAKRLKRGEFLRGKIALPVGGPTTLLDVLYHKSGDTVTAHLDRTQEVHQTWRAAEASLALWEHLVGLAVDTSNLPLPVSSDVPNGLYASELNGNEFTLQVLCRGPHNGFGFDSRYAVWSNVAKVTFSGSL